MGVRGLVVIVAVQTLVGVPAVGWARHALVASLPGIPEDHVRKLARVHVEDTRGIYVRTYRSREAVEALARRSGVELGAMERYAALADLCRIERITPRRADLLLAVGVGSVEELAAQDPEELLARMRARNVREPRTRFLPNAAEVRRWIRMAGRLQPRDWSEPVAAAAGARPAEGKAPPPGMNTEHGGPSKQVEPAGP